MPSGNGLGRNGASQEPLEAELAALRSELAGLRAENTRLLRLLELTPAQARLPGPVQTGLFDAPPGLVNAASHAAAKVAFFGALFGARTDVYAVRWQNTPSGRSGWMPAVRGGWRRGIAATDREYLPLTTQVLTGHLSGELEVGLYPMLDGDQCWWLAADFDGSAAILDALAYSRPPGPSAPRQRWRCPAPGSAPMPGCSSPHRCPPRWLDRSVPACCVRRSRYAGE